MNYNPTNNHNNSVLENTAYETIITDDNQWLKLQSLQNKTAVQGWITKLLTGMRSHRTPHWYNIINVGKEGSLGDKAFQKDLVCCMHHILVQSEPDFVLAHVKCELLAEALAIHILTALIGG